MASARINLPFGDGHYDFCISPIGKILELEEKCDTGVRTILDRLSRDAWKYNDVRETIRIGLVGAGLNPIKALKLVERYIDTIEEERGWAKWAPIARDILLAHMFGAPKEPVGKPSAEGTATETATAGSSPPQSTAGARPSDSIPAPSTQ